MRTKRSSQEVPEICDTVEHKSTLSGASSPKDARMIRTDQALRTALLTLLEHQPLEQITIRQIAAEAEVHYATFFRHHATKEALLNHVAADQINRLVELSLPVSDAVDSRAGFVTLCTYVGDHRALWTALLTGGAAGAMREELLRVSRELARVRAPKGSWLPMALGTACTVSLIVETISWWLTQPPEESSIEWVAKILHRLVHPLTLQSEPTAI
jgi:AcrR family transcriptional regulator